MNDFIDMEMVISALNWMCVVCCSVVCLCIWRHTELSVVLWFRFLRLPISVRLYIPSSYYPHAKSYTPSIFTALSKTFPIQISTCFVLCICVIRPGIEKRQRKYELVGWDMQKEEKRVKLQMEIFFCHTFIYIYIYKKYPSFLSILQNAHGP